MDIHEATRSYERWLAGHAPLLAGDLRLKHRLMAQSSFAFLRATFYRWIQLWPKVCSDLAKAPRVLAVGDLHIENFGTWRDREGRLTWGVNDFDEAFPQAYPIDLVRRATSVLLAIRQDRLNLKPRAACQALLAGYRQSLRQGGQPFVIDEEHRWFVPMVRSAQRDPVRFWARMRHWPRAAGHVPKEALAALAELMPDATTPRCIQHRVAGLGSLGKPRFLALAPYQGGLVAREAKALTPSACLWARPRSRAAPMYYGTILGKAVRCQDPFFRVQGPWLVRRLAPDCCRIELDSLVQVEEELELLQAMGWETANIHLGSGAGTRHRILRELARRPAGWLRRASRQMLQATLEDWKEWRSAVAFDGVTGWYPISLGAVLKVSAIREKVLGTDHLTAARDVRA